MQQPVTGSFELIKNINTACILNKIREKELVSRAEIARSTGLTPATVSNITAELIELGLVRETERGESSGGRKPVLLQICADSCYCAGVHIGSDILETAFTDIEARILWREKQPLDKNVTPGEAMKSVIGLIRKAQAELPSKKMAGIGVCVHGLVRSEEGVSVYAPNLGWENVGIGEILQKEFGVPVYVENDVRAMTLAESWCGLARNVSDYVYLYIGAGIGGSIVMNNELYKGNGGYAGEFGHSTMEPDGPLCTCGNRGCLQALASEGTIVANYRRRKGGSAGPIEFSEVLRKAAQGDEDAVAEIRRSARYIGIELGNIINSLSPSLIVINGTITKLGKPLMDVIEDEVLHRGMINTHNSTRVLFSRLSDSAPLKGAAACIIKRLFEYPRKFL